MGGNEVIFKFLLISYKTSLKSRFSRDPSLFALFLIPYLMDTLRIWYLWKGTFKAHLGVAVSWCTNHFPRNMSAFTGTISRQYHSTYFQDYIQDCLFQNFSPWRFKFHASPPSIQGVFRVVLGLKSRFY